MKKTALLAGLVAAGWLGQCAWGEEPKKDPWKKDILTPNIGPIRPDSVRFPCEDPPDDAMVLRAMTPSRRGLPGCIDVSRGEIEIVKERLVDKIDPPIFVPLIGTLQLHHCHWKCTIYFTETIESGYPFPFRCQQQRIEAIYVAKDHLHVCADSEPAIIGAAPADPTIQILARDVANDEVVRPDGPPAALPSEPQLCPSPTTNARLVADLVKVLDDTESSDTVYLTLEVLESLGADARPAIPAILRNAERLGMITIGYGRVREAVLKILKAKTECPAVEPAASPPRAPAAPPVVAY